MRESKLANIGLGGSLITGELTFYEKASRRALTTPIGVKLGKKKNNYMIVAFAYSF